MPSFEVEGDNDGQPFRGIISVELDGRDIDWRGTPSIEVLDFATNVLSEIVEEIFTKFEPVWKQAGDAHAV